MGRRAADPSKVRKLTVYMVELKIDMPDTPAITFFGSKKAIFEYFGEGALGLSYQRSKHIDFSTANYENSKCRIVEGELYKSSSFEVITRREREGRVAIKNDEESLAKLNARNKTE